MHACRPAATGETTSRLRSLLAWFGGESTQPYRYLLLLRFTLVNVTALALLAALWIEGWLGHVFAGDTTHLVSVIVAVFLLGLALCARKVAQTSLELNQVGERHPRAGTRVALFLDRARRLDAPGRANLAGSLKLKLASRIALVKHVAGALVLLGLVGTVLGFIIALSGVDPDTAADAGAVGPMVSMLISGMSVALYTTLVGSVLNVWLMLNYRILESGTVHLLTRLVDRSEHEHADLR
ncbi:MAG: MotA/TolQ/ExbB proton channel family protein [Geminicoccaceae bacterium]|nr:MotA/TolQ/ExbB proton channel family protein [Geminicoccaceae bacterium]